MKRKFYYSTSIYNTKSAEQIVPYLIHLFQPQTIVDVGCGLGTWLSIFKQNGAQQILGIDACEYHNKMLIQPSEFQNCDLTEDIKIEKRFDLAICLEVAEHLPEIYANIFIKSLTSLSDTIVFSAAIPEQGGQGHLNEQWLEYWKEKFANYGYNSYDAIRQNFWANEKVDWWYKQNMFIVSKQAFFDDNIKTEVYSVVHPEFYNEYRANLKNGNEPPIVYLKLLLKSVKNRLKYLKRIFTNLIK